MDEYDFLIDLMTWSFSRISSFHDCPREWKWKYIDCNKGGENAMSQFGTLCHEILEEYAKGELDMFELPQIYEERFDQTVTENFPPNKFVDMRSLYYKKGLDYFENIDLILDEYEILGVEKRVEFKVGEYDVVGYIDLLLKNKETGEITILDHKSASIKKLKNGKISKSCKEHFENFKRQLYMYSISILEEYGRVDYLKWNLFKEMDFIEIPFDNNELQDAKKWAIETIKVIENEKEYPPKFDYFYCANLCSLSKKEWCPYKSLGITYSTNYSKCYSEKNKEYSEYGEVGIDFCDEWKNDINNFFKWSLENGFSKGMILERKDSDIGFSPENCYFIPYSKNGGEEWI